MAGKRTVVALAVALAVAGAWLSRDRLPAVRAARDAAPPVNPAATSPDVVYRWVDKDGVTHFEQRAGRGQRLQYDGSAITPLPRPDPAALERLREAAEAAPAATAGADGLLGLRQELQEGARRLQAAKSAQGGP